VAAAILLPERKLTICRKRADQASGIESDVLAQMHRHLMTRAQLHGRTLVANRTPFKAISAPIHWLRGRTVYERLGDWPWLLATVAVAL